MLGLSDDQHLLAVGDRRREASRLDTTTMTADAKTGTATAEGALRCPTLLTCA